MMAYPYPPCRRDTTVEDWFGTKLAEPYGWLRDRKDPEVLAFTARENALTDRFFDGEALASRIARLRAEAVRDVPFQVLPWKEGYLATCLKAGLYEIQFLDRDFRLIGALPPVPGLEGALTLSAAPCPRSDDLLAITVEFGGAPRPSIAVCDVSDPQRPRLLHLRHGGFGCCWSKGDGCLYYPISTSDSASRASSTVFYRYDPVSDEERTAFAPQGKVIYGDAYAGGEDYVLFSCAVDYSVAHWTALELKTGTLHPLTDAPRELRYIESRPGEHLFLDYSDTPEGAVVAITDGGARRAALARQGSWVYSGAFSRGGRLYALAREDVGARLLAPESGECFPLPDPWGGLAVAGSCAEGTLLRFESFLHPAQLLLFDGESLRCVLRASDDEPPEDVVVEQYFAPSEGDGTPIPYFMVRRRDVTPDAPHPTLLFAYGGYNLTVAPWYTEKITGIQAVRWAQRGGIYIHAHLRGGDEYGARWHEAGRLLQKRRCYEDFIGVAQQLIRQGWTEPRQLAISGSSNGGLLMSVLVTMRPELWGCVIDSVPQTDMLHLPMDDRGAMYVTEYGDPLESREMFEYLLSYSPYHHIRPIDYPPIYIQTGELDNNVPPCHGKKFAARLQAESRSRHPILLRVLPDGGHDRGRGESYWRTIAEAQLFLEQALCFHQTP